MNATTKEHPHWWIEMKLAFIANAGRFEKTKALARAISVHVSLRPKVQEWARWWLRGWSDPCVIVSEKIGPVNVFRKEIPNNQMEVANVVVDIFYAAWRGEGELITMIRDMIMYSPLQMHHCTRRKVLIEDNE